MAILYCSHSTDFAVLTLRETDLIIYEGDDGDSDTNITCFIVSLNRPRTRDVVYTLEVSNTSTATPGVDFELSATNITITPEIQGEEYMTCVYITIYGDNIAEDDELLVINVVPMSPQDRVDDTNSIRVTFIDNDGDLDTT